jgi:hypothetical protein
MAPLGVDPHPATPRAAAAVTNLGGVRAQTMTSADAAGDQQLPGCARFHLPGRRCWAVERGGQLRRRPCGVHAAARRAGRGGRPAQAAGAPQRRQQRRAGRDPHPPAKRSATTGPAIPRRRGERAALRALLTTRRSATTARVAAIGQPGGADRWRPGGAAGRTTRPQHQQPDRCLRQPWGAADQAAGPPGHRAGAAGHCGSASSSWPPRPISCRPSLPC